jgi:hypothetical protein
MSITLPYAPQSLTLWRFPWQTNADLSTETKTVHIVYRWVNKQNLYYWGLPCYIYSLEYVAFTKVCVTIRWSDSTSIVEE